MEQIEVSPNNPAYTAEDNVLFNKERAILIVCPPSKSGVFRVPDGVVEIGNEAFFGCEDVALPLSVKTIGVSAFEGCSSLESVIIKGKLDVLMQRAFYGCTNLAAVKHGEIAVV